MITNRVDKKGFTIVELIISFTFVMVLSLSLMGLLVSLRSKAEYTNLEGDLEGFTVNLYGTIMKDINNNILVDVFPCNGTSECNTGNLTDGDPITRACVKFKFFNGLEKTLKLQEAMEDIVLPDGSTSDFNYYYFSYAGVDFVPPDKDRINMDLPENMACSTWKPFLSTSNQYRGLKVLNINWPMQHDDILDKVYGLDLTTLVYSKTSPNNIEERLIKGLL